MRDILLFVIFLIILLQTFRSPQAGVLGWTWLTLMTPQKLAWGFSSTTPFNLILAIVTLLISFTSKERRWLQWNTLTVVWLLFAVDITFTSLFSLAPEITWDRWNQTLKVWALGLLIPIVMTTKDRIHALILVIAVSVGYFGIKGGGWVLLTGGGSQVRGPVNTGLEDNNYLALALCLTLPLLNYIRLQSLARFSRIAAAIAMALCAIAVLGTYSRGGFIALAVMGLFLLWRSRRRLMVAAVAVVAAAIAIQFMPEGWTARMQTIQEAQQDASFRSRLDAWQVSLNIAAVRPLTGSGFGSSERPDIYAAYSPENSVYTRRARTEPTAGSQIGGRAYHSIYFQVLGDHGYPGLFLFLALLALTWRHLSQVRRASRNNPGLAWAFELSTMIQVSMIAYVVAGAALSMAYYDMPYLFIGIALSMREIVRAAPKPKTNIASGSVPALEPAPSSQTWVQLP